MSNVRRHIGWLTGGMLMLLPLIMACASYNDEEETQYESAVLKIYVFPPDRPIVTRADNGNVDATEQENAINSLRVWVFEHHDPNDESDEDRDKDGYPVGYISTTSENLPFGQGTQATLTMEVSDDFASRKPNVDVYVMANVTKADYDLAFDLDKNTTRAQLNAALIGIDNFGLTSPVASVPDDGLPMTGVLKNKLVRGDAPVFRVVSSEANDLANVKLVRAVSKVHFVFCSDSNDDVAHTVESISLDGGVIPTTEYLFLNGPYSADGGGDPITLNGYRYKVGNSYESAATLMNTSTSIVPCHSDKSPGDFIWDPDATVPLTGQEYEDLIKEGLTPREVEGVTKPDLNDLGTYYLRESDKNVTGTITYDVDKSATFKLIEKDADFVPGDFGRNHTWIVYGYFSYSGKLNVITVKVKEWQTQSQTQHGVYNW